MYLHIEHKRTASILELKPRWDLFSVKKKNWYWIWCSQLQLSNNLIKEKSDINWSPLAIHCLALPLFSSRTIVIEAIADGSVPLETSCLSSTRTSGPGFRSMPDLLDASSCIAKVRCLLSTALFQFAVFRSVRRRIDKGLDQERERAKEDGRVRGKERERSMHVYVLCVYVLYVCAYIATLVLPRQSLSGATPREREKERGLVHTISHRA